MKKLNKFIVPEHYKDLDAPVYIWNKVHETSDLSWLLVKRKKLNKKLSEFLSKVWEDIYNQYLAEFGWSDIFLDIVAKRKEIIELKMELISTGDRTNLTWIALAEEELIELKEGIGKGGFMQSKMAIERTLRFQINAHTTSIKEFYSYLKELK